ncbi:MULTISPECIES: PaaX family transcriptional regulator C-terminal domain-containing protein [Pseudooceanicola]|nr:MULTISPECIES: PaaX family transcriptional regulator C-terminal domain-containing protein [Pseudooceanicola]
MQMAEIREGTTPRAAAFIVTLYGDAVEPRGGQLWMGTLVESCATQGLSESLVRTAVSRLTQAGQLEGDRIGRRSYYRLTGRAQAEFHRAARVIYAPPPPPQGWLVALEAPAALPGDWMALSGSVAIAPNRSDVAPVSGPVLSAEALGNAAEMQAVVARCRDLAPVAEAYRNFLAAWAAPDPSEDDLPGAEALARRLRLVHLYRLAALSDPRLPPEALPDDWPAAAARALFVRCYCALSPAADRLIGDSFRDCQGLLPAETLHTQRRMDRLRRELALSPRAG